jgi:hypothetical protein
MKKLNIKSLLIFFAIASGLSGCYKLQTDYDYHKQTLDPHINMTAKAFMDSRGKAGVGDRHCF